MTRCPFALWRPGPLNKRYQWWLTNPKDGIVDHSAEGYREVMQALIDDPNNEKSWTFSVYKDLPFLEQHYEVEDIVWHAGYPANLHYLGIEHEGVAGEPLTEPQYTAMVRLHKWLFSQYGHAHGWGHPELRVNLFEHNWLMATACPSGRIPWERLLADLQEDDMALEERLAKVERGLEMQQEAQDIRASLELWLGGYGEPTEDVRFMAFVNAHVAWRLVGKPGWTVPA